MNTKQSKSGRIGEWLTSAFILAAFSLFTPVMLLAVNAQRGAAPGKFLLVAAGAFGVAALIVFLLSRWMSHLRAVAIAAVLLLTFFTWRELQSSAGEVAFWQPALRTLLPLLLSAVLIAVAYRFGEAREFRLVLVVAGAALVLTPLWGLVPWYTGDPTEIEVTTVVGPATAEQQPDVYFVVVDGYGRADVLNELYGFSNEEFLAALRADGFIVPESGRANYQMTAASLSSTLALDYLVPEPVVPDHPLRVALYEVIRGDNPVVEAFQAAGYEYVHIESGWDGSRCGANVDVCYQSGFIDEASWALLGRTPFFPYLHARYGDAFITNGLRVFDDLAEETSREREQPRFVFAHIAIPHPPLYLTRDCEIRPEPQPGGGAVGARFLLGTEELERRMDAYIEQVECVNQKVLRFLGDLGDDTLVFITGDHGPDSFGQVSVPPEDWTAADARERFAVMSAYRLHPECEDRLEEDVDLINGMRIMVDCALGTELPSLPYQGFIFPTPDGAPYPTTEIDPALLGG